MIKVAVTDIEYNKAAEVFKNSENFACLSAPTPEAELAHFIKKNNIAYAIVGVDQYQRALYDALPPNGVIARFGVGHDSIDKIAAKTRGIHCTNTPGALDDSVAECTIALILTAARNLIACATNNSNGIWKNQVGFELTGKTIAIIGYGNIGRKVAKIAQAGFGMNVIGYGRTEPQNRNHLNSFTTDFVEAVKDADFVSIHIPDNPVTADFINSQRLIQMKSSAILINTARGGVVDEAAIYDAVKNGVIAGAALDVFKNEPYKAQNADKDLRTLDTIIMTPHIGSSTVEACKRMALAALNNIQLAVDGHFNEMNIIV